MLTESVSAGVWKTTKISTYTEEETDEPIVVKCETMLPIMEEWEIAYLEAVLLLVCVRGFHPEQIRLGPFDPDMIVEDIPDFPRIGEDSELLPSNDTLAPSSIALATCLYGGLHLSTWHSLFPTDIERWLWRTSAIVIAAFGLYLATGFILEAFMLRFSTAAWEIDQYSRQRRLWRALNWVSERSPRINLEFIWIEARGASYLQGSVKVVRMLYVWITFAVAAVCVIARLYLVVEAFISLRRMPVAVYQVPSWTVWIPHL